MIYVGTAALGCPAARKYRAAAPLRTHQIHDSLKQIADQPTPISSARSFPTSPAASPATTSTISCPKTDSTSPALSSAPKEPAPQFSKPPAASLKVLQSACSSSSPIPTSFNAPTTSPKSWRTSPSASKVSTISSSTTRAPKASILKDSLCSPTAADGSWSSSAARPRRSRVASPRPRRALNRSANPPNSRLYSGQRARRIWDIREASLGVTSHVPGEPLNWEGWEDAAVAPEKLGAYLRDLRKMMDAFNYKGSLYGHFGHACVHTRLNFDLQSKEGIAKFRSFVEEAADLVVSYGGSLSGEHGDGQSRAELLPKMFGPELMQAFREFKSAWDPDWKMNPGKLIGPPGTTPNKLDANLRLGPDYAPWEPATRFQFPADHGSLSHAALRCVGMGKCRREEGGLMCPSYRATHEEEHSTRGRAHLLWEMTQGQGENRRSHSRWLAQRRSRRLSRPLPRLQRLQERLPRQRRRRHLQSRIPFSLLRRPHPPPQRLRFRQHRPLGPPGVKRPRPGKSNNAAPIPARPG